MREGAKKCGGQYSVAVTKGVVVPRRIAGDSCDEEVPSTA